MDAWKRRKGSVYRRGRSHPSSGLRSRGSGDRTPPLRPGRSAPGARFPFRPVARPATAGLRLGSSLHPFRSSGSWETSTRTAGGLPSTSQARPCSGSTATSAAVAGRRCSEAGVHARQARSAESVKPWCVPGLAGEIRRVRLQGSTDERAGAATSEIAPRRRVTRPCCRSRRGRGRSRRATRPP